MDFGHDTFHVEFGEKDNRAASLSWYLESAVQLSDRNLYGPAFTIPRSGLRHAAFDWLVFLGETYVVRMRLISDGTWEEWQRDRAAGADWATNIQTWTRTKKGDMTTRWRGVISAPDEHGTQEKLNIYYFLIDEYHGLLGNGREERPGDN